jgi:hypothetical protein
VITIGILGAFALNSWNDNRKDQTKLISELESFSAGITKDQTQLLRLKDSRKKAKDEISQLIELFESDQTIDSNWYIDLLFSLVIEKKFVPNPERVEILEDNSQMKRIKNSKIYDLSIEYSELIDDLVFYEFRQNEFTEAMENELWLNGYYSKIWPVMRFRANGVEGRPNDLDYALEFKNNSSLKGIFYRTEFVFQALLKKYDEIDTKGKELQAAIKEYIEVR